MWRLVSMPVHALWVQGLLECAHGWSVCCLGLPLTLGRDAAHTAPLSGPRHPSWGAGASLGTGEGIAPSGDCLLRDRTPAPHRPGEKPAHIPRLRACAQQGLLWLLGALQKCLELEKSRRRQGWPLCHDPDTRAPFTPHHPLLPGHPKTSTLVWGLRELGVWDASSSLKVLFKPRESQESCPWLVPSLCFPTDGPPSSPNPCLSHRTGAESRAPGQMMVSLLAFTRLGTPWLAPR